MTRNTLRSLRPTGTHVPRGAPDMSHPAALAEKPGTQETPTRRVQSGVLDPTLLRRAVPDALRKLDPRTMVRNPVMFVVEVGATLSTVLAVSQATVFAWTVVVWLWNGGRTCRPSTALSRWRGSSCCALTGRGSVVSYANTGSLPRDALNPRPDGASSYVRPLMLGPRARDGPRTKHVEPRTKTPLTHHPPARGWRTPSPCRT